MYGGRGINLCREGQLYTNKFKWEARVWQQQCSGEGTTVTKGMGARNRGHKGAPLSVVTQCVGGRVPQCLGGGLLTVHRNRVGA